MAEESSSSESGGNASSIAGIVGVAISTVGGLIIQGNNAKAVRELQSRIAMLTLQQQREIAERLQDVQSDVERMRIVYQALAVEKNRASLESIAREKNHAIMWLSVSVALLAGTIAFLKTRKNA